MVLLDDLVPGIWAEMLNDRKLAGVEPANASYYYTGAPNVCDREWDASDAWRRDAAGPFAGFGPRRGEVVCDTRDMRQPALSAAALECGA